jgi:hypothetical protein
MLTKVALRLYCYNIINYLLKVFYIHTQDILPHFLSLMSIHEDIVRYIYLTVDIYPSLLNDGLLKKERRKWTWKLVNKSILTSYQIDRLNLRQ